MALNHVNNQFTCVTWTFYRVSTEEGGGSGALCGGRIIKGGKRCLSGGKEGIIRRRYYLCSHM